MKPTFAVCAVLVGLLALSQSAIAEQKTASQCNDDWSANKASIQASGKTKRVFTAECRGVALAAPASVAAPAEKGAERICAKKTRSRPAFARPSLQGARRPDVRVGERTLKRRDGALAAPSLF